MCNVVFPFRQVLRTLRFCSIIKKKAGGLSMKTGIKLYALILALLLIMGGFISAASAEGGSVLPEAPSESDEEMLLAMFSANENRSVLSRHTNMTIRQDVYEQGSVIGSYTVYADRETYCSESTSGFALLTMNDIYLEKYTDGYHFFLESLLEDPDAYKTELKENKDATSLRLADGEHLLHLQVSGNGAYVLTETQDEAFISSVLSYNSETYGTGLAFEEGMTMRWVYHFDTGTKDLQKVATFVQTADGNNIPCMLDVYTYDGNPFDAADSAFSEYFAAEDLRTIYIVFDVGTRLQHRETYTIPAGVYFDVMVDGEFVTEFYADPACTRPFDLYDTANAGNNTILYVKADWKTKL